MKSVLTLLLFSVLFISSVKSQSNLKTIAEQKLNVYLTSSLFEDNLLDSFQTDAFAFRIKNASSLRKLRGEVINQYAAQNFDFDTLHDYVSSLLILHSDKLWFNGKTDPVSKPIHSHTNKAAGDPCTNMDFETCDFTGWERFNGEVNGNVNEVVNVTAAGGTGGDQTFITSTGTDPVVPISTTNPISGNCSAQIGDGTGTNYGAGILSQTFLVSTANSVYTYSYAAVLENPGHTAGEQPFFIIRMFDESGDPITCGDYEVTAGSGADPDWITQGDVMYKDWSTVFAPLDAYVGQNVTIEFTTGDCGQGGHYGYAYVDAECSPQELVLSSPTVCGGSTVTLTAPAGAASYLWSPGGETTQIITVSDPGNYEVTITPVTGAACSTTLTATVGGSPDIPTADFSFAPTAVCINDVVTFTDESTITGVGTISEWSWDFDDGSALSTAQSPTHTYTTSGNYTVELTVTTLSGCTDQTSQVVNVSAPLDATITPAGPFCEDDPAVNLTSASAGGTWTGTGITSGAAGTFNPTTAGDGSHVITYSIAGQCPTSDTETIVVNPVDDASFNYTDNSYCEGDADPTPNILATIGGTFTISGAGVIDAATGVIDISASGTGNLTITYTTLGVCPDVETFDITINPGPDPTITPAGPFCEDAGSVTLVSANPGGTWSGTGITNAATGEFDPATAGDGSHVITYAFAGACSSQDTETIEVNPLDDASFDYTNNSYCEGDADPTPNILATTGGTFTISGAGVIDAATGVIDISASGTGNLTITYTTLGVCPDVETFDITINPGPDPTITAAGPFCVDAPSEILTSADPGGTWSGTGITNAATGEFDPAIAGDGSHVVTYAFAGACASSDTETIIVNSLDDATFSYPNASYCIGETDPTPAINVTLGGTFTINNGGTIDASTGVVDLDVSGLGTYDITYTTFGSCPDNSVETLTITDLFDATLTPAGPFCTTDPIVTIAAATAGATWSSDCGACLTSGGDFDPSLAGAGSWTITYEMTGSCGDVDNITIVVEEVTLDNVTLTNPLCFGDCNGEIDIQATGATEYSIDNGVNYVPASTFIGQCDGTYDIIVRNALGCNATSTETLTEPTELTIAFSAFDVICFDACDGSAIVIPDGGTNNIGYNYSWTPATAGGNTPSVSNLCNGNYSLTVSDDNGCSVIQPFVIDQPVAVSLNVVSEIDELCFDACDGSAEVSSAQATLFSMDGGVLTGNTLFDNLCDGTYTIRGENNAGCFAETTVTINSPAPVTLTTSTDTTICIGGSAILNATAGGGNGVYDFIWSTAETTASITVADVNNFYTVDVVDGNGCTTNQEFVIVSLNPPLDVVALPETISICPGDQVDLAALATSTGDGNILYTWSESGTNIGFGNTISVSPIANPTNYLVTLSDGCETPDATATVVVTINDIPAVDFSNNYDDGCVPLTVDFTNIDVPAGSQYFWDFGDGNGSVDALTTSNTYTDPGCYDVELSIIDANGCENTITYASMVCTYAFPNAEFSFGPQPTSFVEPEIEFTNESTGAVDYNWTFAPDVTPATSNDVNPTIMFPIGVAGTYDVCLEAVTPYGCADVICHEVVIDPEFIIYTPNAFTPDGDGINDVFFPVISGADPLKYKMYIFNRWGDLIWQTNLLNQGWDGTIGNGVMSQTDVYVWKIIVEDIVPGTKHEYTGHVSLLK